MTSRPKLDAEIKKYLEEILAEEQSLCSSFTEAKNIDFSSNASNHVLYLSVSRFASDSLRETERCPIYPPFLGFLTTKEVPDDCLSEFPLSSKDHAFQVSFKNHGAVELSATELRNLCWFHFALLETILFQGKIFGIASSKENKEVLQSLLEDMKHFMKTTTEESWYLIIPLLENEVQESYNTETNKQSYSLIDHGYARDVVASIRNFHHVGVPLPYLEQPTTVIAATYNESRYIVRLPIKTVNFKDMFQQDTIRCGDGDSGASITYEEYYKKVLKFPDLDYSQKLTCAHNTMDGPFPRIARHLLDLATNGKKISTHSSRNMFVVPSLFCVHPLRSYTISTSASTLATCWKFESMLKVADLRQHLVLRASLLSGTITCPSVDSLFQAVTVKAIKEHVDYERVEFLGDTVLKLIVCLHTMFMSNSSAVSDSLQDEKGSLLCNRTLAHACVHYGLNKYIRLNKLGDHSWRPPGFHLIKEMMSKYEVFPQDLDMWYCAQKANYRFKVLADVVESMTGVFYLQGGFLSALFIANELGIAPFGYMLNCAIEQANDGKDTWMRSLLAWNQLSEESLSSDNQKLNRLEVTLNYKFSNLVLPNIAMNQNPGNSSCLLLSRTSLASLGDALLDILVIENLWTQYPDMTVGDLTSMKQLINNKDRLFDLALLLEFDKLTDFSNDDSIQLFYGQNNQDSAKGEVLTEEQIYCLKLAGFTRGLVTATYFDNYGSLSELRRVWNPLLQPIMKTDTPAPRKLANP